jgi:NADPH:quinone reductase
VQPGETILIVGARGAVVQAATQIANWKRAHVIGADVSSDPIPGTVSVVNTGTEDLRAKVLDLTAGKGVDVVFDTVAGSMFERALRSLSYGGRQTDGYFQARESRASVSILLSSITIFPGCSEQTVTACRRNRYGKSPVNSVPALNLEF